MVVLLFVSQGAILTQTERPPPNWSSPGDDLNFLDGLWDWLVRQPLPTRDILKNAPIGQEAAALLPQTTSHTHTKQRNATKGEQRGIVLTCRVLLLL